MINPHRILFPDDPDPLERWRADNERRERELAAEREREEREQRTELREATLLRAEVEFRSLRAATATRRN